MHRELILKAFEKAKKDTGSSKLTHWATHLSDYINEKSGEPYGERSLRDCYRSANENEESNIELKQYIVQSLCSYLGYNSFNVFLEENPVKEGKKKYNFINKINKQKTIIGSIVIALLIGYTGYDLVKKDCMIWVDDHYEKIKCEKRNEIKIVPFNKVIFDNLEQVDPECKYPFFKSDGSENLWYGKSTKGELEYFTYYGLHPITQKTLDPITQYMIDEHICN